MNPSLYPTMAALEDSHWWFVARRAIVQRALDRIPLQPDAAILEAGCGTGGNLDMLSRRGRLYAMEYDPVGMQFAAKRGVGAVSEGRLPDLIPFERINFDLVAMIDVLEHLEDERAALDALRARMKPGGWLVVTVPAMEMLWSAHDVSHHHFRRYTGSSLRRVVAEAGFAVEYLSHYNTLLFPAIAAIRLLKRAATKGDHWADNNGCSPESDAHDLKMPPRLLNRLLAGVMGFERHAVGKIRMPFGVSLLLLARRRD